MEARIVVRALAALALCAVLAAGCGSSHHPGRPVVGTPRTYRMGFSAIPPRNDFPTLLANLDLWTRHADAAIVHIEPPWEALIGGARPDTMILRDPGGLVTYYRGKHLALWITLDATNGLDRSAESAALTINGHSLTEPAIQQLYRDYAVALDTLLHPDHFALAAETNLIRLAAPAPLYAAVKQVANDAAADIRAVDTRVPLSVSVQVEVAWGRLGGAPQPYTGVEQDFTDFPFVQELGLSSYPYFGWTDPDSLPGDYYLRLLAGRALPVAVVEGGWTSASVVGVVSDPIKQSRYITKQAALLDTARAIGVFQLTFSDLDLAATPPPPGSTLPLFASLGLVDVNLRPKPALGSWDATLARPRVP